MTQRNIKRLMQNVDYEYSQVEKSVELINILAAIDRELEILIPWLQNIKGTDKQPDFKIYCSERIKGIKNLRDKIMPYFGKKGGD